MASFNRVILVGNLTRDPELRYIPSGTAVSEIGLAVNDRVKRGDQWVDETTFVDITLWGRTAEIANEYLSKGSPVLIEGRLKLDRWEKDGQKHSKLKVVGERMQMLGAARAAAVADAAAAAAAAAARGGDAPAVRRFRTIHARRRPAAERRYSVLSDAGCWIAGCSMRSNSASDIQTSSIQYPASNPPMKTKHTQNSAARSPPRIRPLPKGERGGVELLLIHRSSTSASRARSSK